MCSYVFEIKKNKKGECHEMIWLSSIISALRKVETIARLCLNHLGRGLAFAEIKHQDPKFRLSFRQISKVKARFAVAQV